MTIHGDTSLRIYQDDLATLSIMAIISVSMILMNGLIDGLFYNFFVEVVVFCFSINYHCPFADHSIFLQVIEILACDPAVGAYFFSAPG
jgi:hypothetical protein